MKKNVLRIFEGPACGRIISEFRGLGFICQVLHQLQKKAHMRLTIPSFASGRFSLSSSSLAG
jgi:hypothetical protein